MAGTTAKPKVRMTGFETYTGNIVSGGKGATGNVAPLNAKAAQNNAKKSGASGKPKAGKKPPM